MKTPTTRPDFLTTLASLANVPNDVLVHMVLVHPEGSIPGDAAWAALTARHGMHRTDVLVSNERAAREADIAEQRAEARAA